MKLMESRYISKPSQELQTGGEPYYRTGLWGWAAVVLAAGLVSCAPEPPEAEVHPQAFVGADIIDGTGLERIRNGAMIVGEDGRISDIGPREQVDIPEDAMVHDVTGRYITPGIINAHGHVGGVQGLESGEEYYTREYILEQLGRYARYGVTTVISLGGDGPEGVEIRNEQNHPGLRRTRLFVAGPVIDPESEEQAREDVAMLADMDVDWVKIRVDDFLGQAEKMPRPVYMATIDAAHEHGLRHASHMLYLEDAKSLVAAGTDLLAHSVRDEPVDEELMDLMAERDVCLSPTLTREWSTSGYAERPDFFDDPFFLREADSQVISRLEDPEVQQCYTGEAAGFYEQALPLAKQNMVDIANSGLRIAFGTDSGPPARFQGYFEHKEMEMMQEAGLSPMQILLSMTFDAAACMGVEEELGTLEPGKWADFLILQEDPMEDITNMRSFEQVRIAGNPVPDLEPPVE